MPRWTRSDKLALLAVLFAIIGSGAGVAAMWSTSHRPTDRRGVFIPPSVRWEQAAYGVRIAFARTDHYRIHGFGWTDSQPLSGCTAPRRSVVVIREVRLERESDVPIGLVGETETGDRVELSLDPELGHGRLAFVELSWLSEVIRVDRRVLATYRNCSRSLHVSEVLAE